MASDLLEMKGSLADSESPREECPFCGARKLAGDRIANHVWTTHREEIEEAADA